MKQIIFLLAIFCTISAKSQEIKPLLIGGAGKMYHDNYDRGHYYYGYFDYKPIQNNLKSTALGVYAKYNYWYGLYNGDKKEEINSFGAGLSFGFVPNLNYDMYNNISLGYRESKHTSWTKDKDLPNVRKKFIDMTMYSHFMDKYSTSFFRHKIFVDMSYRIADSSFKNENFRIKLDESIYNFYIGEKLNLAPKVILGYTSNPWHKFYELGVGADLFSQWFVNILDLSVVYRYDPDEAQKSYIEISAGVDLFNIFNY